MRSRPDFAAEDGFDALDSAARGMRRKAYDQETRYRSANEPERKWRQPSSERPRVSSEHEGVAETIRNPEQIAESAADYADQDPSQQAGG